MLERHSGQILGSLWAFRVPLLADGIYVSALPILLQRRLQGSRSSLDYAVFGLTPSMAVQAALGRELFTKQAPF